MRQSEIFKYLDIFELAPVVISRDDPLGPPGVHELAEMAEHETSALTALEDLNPGNGREEG